METVCDKGKPTGTVKVKVKLEAFAPCPEHGPQGIPCTCMHKPEHSLGVREKDDDLFTKQFAQFVQALIFNSTQTIADTSNATHSVANASATTAPTILAGTSGTAATVTDVALGTQTETVAGTVNAYSGSGASGSFTITGTIVATADRAYQEVGLRVTNGGNSYLVCHDTFSTLNVSNTGTLAVTYTLTWS